MFYFEPVHSEARDKQRGWAAGSLHVTTLSQLPQDESQNFLLTGLACLILPCELEHNPASGPLTHFCLYNVQIWFSGFFFFSSFHPKQASLRIRNNLHCMFYILYI